MGMNITTVVGKGFIIYNCNKNYTNILESIINHIDSNFNYWDGKEFHSCWTEYLDEVLTNYGLFENHIDFQFVGNTVAPNEDTGLFIEYLTNNGMMILEDILESNKIDLKLDIVKSYRIM